MTLILLCHCKMHTQWPSHEDFGAGLVQTQSVVLLLTKLLCAGQLNAYRLTKSEKIPFHL